MLKQGGHRRHGSGMRHRQEHGVKVKQDRIVMRGKRQIRDAGKGRVYIGKRNAGVCVGRHGSKLHIGVAKH